MSHDRSPLLCLLATGGLYGIEWMTIATARALHAGLATEVGTVEAGVRQVERLSDYRLLVRDALQERLVRAMIRDGGLQLL